MALLTKSKYLNGLQCPLLLWVTFNDKNSIPPVDLATQATFDAGNLVGELAKKLFPGGVDVPQGDFMGNINATKKLIQSRNIIFEAGIMNKNCYSRADILVPVADNEWDIYEVKSSTSVKPVNISDISFQKYVYENSGLKIRKCFLTRINNNYVRNGEIDVNKLFKSEDITSDVESEIIGIQDRIYEMFKIIASSEPNIKIGPHCTDPYACPITKCSDHIPKNSVFDLSRIGKKGFELYNDGLLNIKDIPLSYKLNEKQNIQRACELSSKVHVDKKAIKDFLDKLIYPLHYLDFETFNEAIPLFENVKPYQQIPFQYSLHTVEKNNNIKHFEFLYNGSSDPRLEFIQSLKNSLGNNGSVVVYNESFEKARLLELAEIYPEYKEWVDSVILRFIDLLIPFRNFDYYNSLQVGSASIKKVLPALTGKTYSDLDIGDGATASISYMNIFAGKITGLEKEKIRADLLKYCSLDTEGMIWIVDELNKLIN